MESAAIAFMIKGIARLPKRLGQIALASIDELILEIVILEDFKTMSPSNSLGL